MIYTKEPTLVCDIDGVIATGTVEEVYSDEAGWAYEKCRPLEKMIHVLDILSSKGVKIILYTSRLESDRKKTVSWLDTYNVPWDDLIMNKPYSHLYVDDRAYGYENLEQALSVSSRDTIADTLYRRLMMHLEG